MRLPTMGGQDEIRSPQIDAAQSRQIPYSGRWAAKEVQQWPQSLIPGRIYCTRLHELEALRQQHWCLRRR